ncbi:ribonuclease H-like domain-containing protein [Tanacetum coccineum]
MVVAVSNERCKSKFFKSLPFIMEQCSLDYEETKMVIDDLDIDDLYNNLKLLEVDIKGSSGSSLNSQNMAFLSGEDTRSSNEVNTANGVSIASDHNSQGQASSSSYTDDLMFSFFANQSNSARGGKITGKGKIRTDKLDFEDVFFVKVLKFNLFSVLQMCDKKNNVLFTETECLVLSPDFKLLHESLVLLRVPRQSNMYSFELKNVVPSEDLTCLFAKAIIDKSNLWHRRLGHANFKTMNKLVKGNLVRGLPSKIFDNDYTCVACQKGVAHKDFQLRPKTCDAYQQPLRCCHYGLIWSNICLEYQP